MVLDDADRLPVRRLAATSSARPLALYLLNPITAIVLTFQRAIYGQVTSPNGRTAGHDRHQILPHGVAWWYLRHLGVVVRRLASCCSSLALVVFGRLEGNFAEEL